MEQSNFIVNKIIFVIAYYEEGQGKFGLIYNVMADQLFYGVSQFDVCAMKCFQPEESPFRTP